MPKRKPAPRTPSTTEVTARRPWAIKAIRGVLDSKAIEHIDRMFIDLYSKIKGAKDYTASLVASTIVSERSSGEYTPAPHAESHENGGSDEIDVNGLSGLLADQQTPLDHTHRPIAGQGGALAALYNALDEKLADIVGNNTLGTATQITIGEDPDVPGRLTFQINTTDGRIALNSGITSGEVTVRGYTIGFYGVDGFTELNVAQWLIHEYWRISVNSNSGFEIKLDGAGTPLDGFMRVYSPASGTYQFEIVSGSSSDIDINFIPRKNGLFKVNGKPVAVSATAPIDLSSTGNISLDDDGVTYSKIQNVSAASRILGRGSAAGAGDVQELTAGSGLNISGTVVSAEAWPIGSVFIAIVNTNPNTLLGYGTWSAIATGRFLVGVDSGNTRFDSPEETGGATTHTHTYTEVVNHTHPVNITDPGHLHAQNAPSSANGGTELLQVDNNASGSTPAGLNTETATTGITATTSNPSGGVATGTTAATDHLPPFFAVYMWKRIA